MSQMTRVLPIRTSDKFWKNFQIKRNTVKVLLFKELKWALYSGMDCDPSTQQAKVGLWVECHPELHSQTLCQETQNGNNQVITIDNAVDLTNLSYMSKK